MTYHADTAAAADPTPLVAAARRGGGRARWEVWRSPEEQPWWARPILLAIAAFAAALYSWNIATAGYALFYGNSVRSMSVSWKAWLFGAMDPGATITLDKIPGAFAVQALFVRLFGFHQWSVTLPQVIEGVIAVLVLYRVVRRWAGPAAGLIAAGVFTFTPVVASMFGHSMEDGALTCCLVLAADRFQVAVMRGKLRSLIWAGVWVGVGFQMKMMQAWLVLPAFALAYLLVAQGRLRRRVWHTVVAGGACLAVSVAWVAMMAVVPAKDRPYVDGSTNNSAIAMVFGYNGLDRFGVHLPGAVESMFSGGTPKGRTPGGGFGDGAPGVAGPPGGSGVPGGGGGSAGSGAAGAPEMPGMPNIPGESGTSGNGPTGTGGSSPFGGPALSGRPGGGGGMVGGPQGGDSSPWLKLFQGRFAPQISWLLPFALLMILLGLYQRRRAERTDVLRAGFVTWGAWLLTVGLVFSDMATIPHTAYMATLAPAIAALCGAGTVLLWRAHRAGGHAGLLLPVVVAAQAAWTWYLWSGFGSFAPWLRWAGLVAALLAAVVLVLGRLGGRARARVAAVGAVIGLATTAVGSVAWASSAFDASYDGSAFDAGAGPQGGMGVGMGTHLPQAAEGVLKNAQSRGGLAGPGGMDPSDKLTGDEQQLWNYVKAHQDGAEYPLATVGWNAAQPYILATGEKVLPMGGFSGQIPQPTPAAFTALVHQGRVHFVLTGGGGMGMTGGSGDAGGGNQIATWTTAHCSEVPSSDYGVSQVAGSSGARDAGAFGGPFGGAGGGTLYRCDTGA